MTFVERYGTGKMDLKNATVKIIEEVRPYSMSGRENLAFTARVAIEAIEAGVEGDFAECGTWLGGASFAMLLAQRYVFGKIVRPVWMFDSFQGLPRPDERDGPLALAYTQETDSPDYFDNCTAPLAKVLAAVAALGFRTDEAIVVPGWFKDTLSPNKGVLTSRGIAVLRVDCDFYEPVSYVLNELTPLVPEGGIVILDDYYAWDGCARATHAFLSQNNLSWRIRSMDRFQGAWMVKQAYLKKSL
jgi:O-methyltransferase